ncbi:MAG: hypothetical protein IT521_05425 [Burkholderiales bacterium]|nr:hypothetical protein [Burkholderiales bacterium]
MATVDERGGGGFLDPADERLFALAASRCAPADRLFSVASSMVLTVMLSAVTTPPILTFLH